VASCFLVVSRMAIADDISIETDFSDVDAFLNAEAAKSKELGLQPEATVEVCH
jgi:hypothetical protein